MASDDYVEVPENVVTPCPHGADAKELVTLENGDLVGVFCSSCGESGMLYPHRPFELRTSSDCCIVREDDLDVDWDIHDRQEDDDGE